MADKSKQPSASSFFQPISQDEYKVQLRRTVPIGPSSPPPISKEEKREDEEKRDSKGHIIKPTQNAFDVLSRVGDGSATFHDNLALTTNYSRERT